MTIHISAEKDDRSVKRQAAGNEEEKSTQPTKQTRMTKLYVDTNYQPYHHSFDNFFFALFTKNQLVGYWRLSLILLMPTAVTIVIATPDIKIP